MNACSRTAALWATLSIGTHSKSRELRVTTISTLTRHHSSHDSGLSRAALQHLQKKTKAPPRRSPKHTHQTGTYPHSKSEKKASGLPAHPIHTHTHTHHPSPPTHHPEIFHTHSIQHDESITLTIRIRKHKQTNTHSSNRHMLIPSTLSPQSTHTHSGFFFHFGITYIHTQDAPFPFLSFISFSPIHPISLHAPCIISIRCRFYPIRFDSVARP